MYLVHVLLSSRVRDAELTADAVAHLRALASAYDAIEHVMVHTDAGRYPVAGIFLLAVSVERAEAVAAAAVTDALRREPALRDWEIRKSEVPLIALDT